MWEGLSLPHDTKFGNCRCKIVDSRSFHSWSLIHGLRWSGLIKVGPGEFPLMGWVVIYRDNISQRTLVQILTHWGQVTHICVSKQTIIGSGNGLSPGRRQAIIWTNAGILLRGTLGTNFSEILSKIHTFSFKKMHLKISSAKWLQFCVGLNVLMVCILRIISLLLCLGNYINFPTTIS